MTESGTYTARKRWIENGQHWVIEFRHPLLFDSGGKLGAKVTRTLKTKDHWEADRIVEQLNQLLSRIEFHDISKRHVGQEAFGDDVATLFYSPLLPPSGDALEEIAERWVPRPADALRIAIAGPTASGKSTFVRKLMSFPDGVSIPAVGAGATTIAPFEIITSRKIAKLNGLAVLHSEQRVRELIEENLAQAIATRISNKEKAAVLDRFLVDIHRQFPLRYCLAPDKDQVFLESVFNRIDQIANIYNTLNQTLEFPGETSEDERQARFIDAIRPLTEDSGADTSFQSARDLFSAVVTETFEEVRKKLLSRFPEDAEMRMTALRRGSGKDQWPEAIQILTQDTNEFYKLLGLFNGISRSRWGELFTPFVSYLRMQKPGNSEILAKIPEDLALAFLDLQGIGHAGNKAESLAPDLVDTLLQQDVILYVNASLEGIQAAGLALLRLSANAGMTSSLRACMTQFDQIHDERLETVDDRKGHVFASMQSAIRALVETESENDGNLGVSRETARALETHLENHTYYFEDMNRQWEIGSDQAPKFSENEIRRLMESLSQAKKIDRNQTIETHNPRAETSFRETPPKLSEESFANTRASGHVSSGSSIGQSLTVSDFHEEFSRAGDRFLKKWERILETEHWTRIRALNRRMADRTGSSYEELNPVGDLHDGLLRAARKMLEESDLSYPEIEEKSQRISRKLLESCMDSLYREPWHRWKSAYRKSGTGQASRRRTEIVGILRDTLRQSVKDSLRLGAESAALSAKGTRRKRNR